MRSYRVEERATDILAIWERRKDISREELRLVLSEVGLSVCVAGLHRFFVRRRMTRRKDWPCNWARPFRRPETAPGMALKSDRSGT